MDYSTFFLTNIATVIVFTVSVTVLAWYNRRVTGMVWFAGALITGLIKLVLQGISPGSRAVYTDLPANELYLVSIAMQFEGLHWFVERKAARFLWLWIAVGLLLLTYMILFFLRVPYIGNVLNIPFVAICLGTAWVLARSRREGFLRISRVAAVVVFAQGCVAGYRAVITNLYYVSPWATNRAQYDPHWMYSLAAAAFLAACMAMCFIWFLVCELNGELAAQALTDPLTGALNWRALEAAAQREAARSSRHGFPLSIIMIDIDDFKLLNDAHGHAAGDLVLKDLVRTVKSMLRTQDLFARTGGEEFAILLPDTTIESGMAIAERIRKAIEGLVIKYEGKKIVYTISAGVSQFDSARGFEGVMRRADKAMYKAKEQGRNRVILEAGDEAVA